MLLTRDGHITSWELRNDGNAGAAFEILIRLDDETQFWGSRVDEAARHYANAFRQDHVGAGLRADAT